MTLKAAVTLDGKIASAGGDSRWITSEESRRRVHELRDRVDAVLVGANTASKDNPRLTVRSGRSSGRNPARVVVDSKLRLSPKLAVFDERAGGRTMVATTLPPSSRRVQRFAAAGVEVWSVKARTGRVDLKALLGRLCREGMTHVLVEGGAQVFSSVLSQGLADELWVFVAPKLVGAGGLTWTGSLPVKAMASAMAVGELQVEKIGTDVLVRCQLGRN